MTPGRTPGRSPSYNLRMSPSQMASPAVRGGAWLIGVVQGMVGGARLTTSSSPGDSMAPSHASLSDLADAASCPRPLCGPQAMSPFNDSIMFSPIGEGGIMFSPGPATSPGYR